jgi:polar amino acid transport system ATP-binding protein
VTALGHRVMEGIARSLELPADYFASRYTADPLILFRIFQYPSRPIPDGLDVRDGVGEHTDYGLLTLLRQDAVGGCRCTRSRAGSRRRRCRSHSSATSATCSIG